MRGQMSSALVHVETSHCHIAMTFCHIAMTSSKQFGISGCSDARFCHMTLSRCHMELGHCHMTISRFRMASTHSRIASTARRLASGRRRLHLSWKHPTRSHCDITPRWIHVPWRRTRVSLRRDDIAPAPGKPSTRRGRSRRPNNCVFTCFFVEM